MELGAFLGLVLAQSQCFLRPWDEVWPFQVQAQPCSQLTLASTTDL